MYKVIFIIVPSCSKSEWLNDKMMQITEAFISITNKKLCPTIVVKDYNNINQFLDKAELIVVSTAGVVVIEPDHLWNKINNFPDDVGLMAHILKHPQDITPYIHEQFFIINTRAVDTINLTFDGYYNTDIELIRSDEDMHGGHAPLYVTLGDEEVYRYNQFGTDLIEHVLKNKYKVMNFDQNWRYPLEQNTYITAKERLPSKGFCYPTISTGIFEQSLKDLTSYPGLDQAQDTFIDAVNRILKFSVLNAWQYDMTPDVSYADTVICTANGFLAELIAYHSQATHIVFYDKNPNNLRFKQYLYAEWDGNDYDLLVDDWAKEYQLAVEPTFDHEKQQSNLLKDEINLCVLNDWKNWCNTVNVKFVQCDLVTDIDMLLEEAVGQTILHTSTILNIFPFTAIVHDRDAIENTKETIKSSKVTWIES